MDIKLKYKSWIGEKHADIAHKLIGNDIETFALEFAEHLVKNCSIPNVVGRSEQLKPLPPNECDICGTLIDSRLTTCGGCGF